MKLRFKLPLSYVLVIFLVGVTLLLFNARLIQKKMEGQQREHFTDLAHVLALNSADSIIHRDYAALERIVDRVRRAKHVRYAAVLDRDGLVLAEAGNAVAAKSADKRYPEITTTLQTVAPNRLLVEAPFKIAGKQWGVVRIAFSSEALREKISATKSSILGTGLLALVIGGTATLWISWRIAGPLERLRDAAAGVSVGRYERVEPIKTNDEMEALADTFNQMCEDILFQYRSIERAKQEWEGTFDSVSAPLFLHDAECRIIRCNRAYAELAGRSFDDIIGEYYYEIFPKSDGPMAGCRRELADAAGHGEEEELYDPGSARHFSARSFGICNDAGDYLYSLHIFHDITERKQAEAAMRASQESLAEAQRIAHLGSWDWDIKNGSLAWSDEVYRIFGLSPGAFPATYEAFLEAVHPEDRSAVRAGVARALETDAPYRIEHRIVRPDGGERIVQEQGRVYRDEGSVPQRMVGTVQDITERRQAEDAFHGLFKGALTSLATALEAKSPWTQGHSQRVARYAVALGREMGLDDGRLEKLQVAALLHDIGKIGTYDGILDKPGKLTEEEYALVTQHPAKGAEMLAPLAPLEEIVPWVRGHHERYDGRGYPDGVAGSAIPLEARILAVADTYDSLTSARPYRKSASADQAAAEIERCSMTQFDPEVVAAFRRLRTAGAIPVPDSRPSCENGVGSESTD